MKTPSNDINNLPTNISNISTQFIPTFHILIATAGKPCLINMLNSLKYQLNENDAITIVFDGTNALKQSKFSNNWLIGHKSKITVIEQTPNLGFWGHGIRNKYQSILKPRTTFILNADDDDIYVAGTFKNLRRLCTSPTTLYIAKFFVKSKSVIVPIQNMKIIQNDIGTPCGIIPFDIASKSVWEHWYGGDFNYYDNIQKYCQEIKFLDTIIYLVS